MTILRKHTTFFFPAELLLTPLLISHSLFRSSVSGISVRWCSVQCSGPGYGGCYLTRFSRTGSNMPWQVAFATGPLFFHSCCDGGGGSGDCADIDGYF